MMKRTSFLILLAVLILFVSCTQNAENHEQMITAAKQLDEKFITAYNKGDVDALMDTYWNSPELVSYPPETMDDRGWQAVKESTEKAFSGMHNINLELLDPNYRVAGNVVIGWGEWRLTIRPIEGKPVVLRGRYTDVKAQRNGKWVYILDHSSVPLTPAAH